MPSGNGQLNPACLAFSKYSPTVLLETLQTRAIARLENPSFFNRNTSRILRTGKCSLGIPISFFFKKIGYPDYMSFPVLSFPYDCAISTGHCVRYAPVTLCDMLRFMHQLCF